MINTRTWTLIGAWIIALTIIGCGEETGGVADTLSGSDTSDADSSTADATDADVGEPDVPRVAIDRPPGPANEGVHAYAGDCVSLDVAAFGSEDIRFVRADGDAFAIDGADASTAAVFRMQPTDLGTFLFYDAEGRYLTAPLPDAEMPATSAYPRLETLDSDISLLDDAFVSPAEWALETSTHDATRWQLRHLATGWFLGHDELREAETWGAIVTLYPAEGCATFPELSLDAEGAAVGSAWPDGDLYGVVETHAHLFTNFAFGGGGIFHGAPFHRLGVEHALSSCEQFHGPEGRKDVVGYAIEGDIDNDDLLDTLLNGETPDFNHFPHGYPEFTDWPNAWNNLTHQAMYYRWLERAWMGGLRVFVQHATGNSVLCELVTGSRWQSVRYSCNDMVSVDRQIQETYNMERYIDALHGGPGLGWFRIVHTPAEARAIVAEGKLAVLLGIEISNLFDCFLTPQEGFEVCDAQTVRDKLDAYHALGIRAVFPVHKYDNAFSAGDGQRGIIEIGNFINSGHWSNFTDQCPDIPITFDRGSLDFAGINQPRDEYFSPAPNDMSDFARSPLLALLPHAETLQSGGLAGEFCQNAGMTPLGETLMLEMMQRGMIIDIDHLPKRSLVRAYELLVENDYPASATHGNNNNGQLYALGGVSNSGLGRCADENDPSAMARGLQSRVAQRVAEGAYPAEGFGFDLNGFAHSPRPRFGADSRCSAPQSNPVEYPFASYDGEVMFTTPQLGVREVDFNTEGMLHIGLMPELIEDARRNGVTDAELEPLFRSAEGYIRMWERAEARAADLQ